MSRVIALLASLCVLIFLALAAGTLAVFKPEIEVAMEFTSEPTVTMIAVGDIMTSRMVGRKLRAVPDPLYPFSKIQEYLHTADFAFGNLETSVTEGDLVGPVAMQFRSDPDVVRRLHEAGFRLLSIANNHTHDFGSAGLIRTVQLLKTGNLAAAGAGENETSAYQPAVIEVKGIRIALLAYVEPDFALNGVAALENRPGVAVMNIGKMRAAVQAAHKEADIVIVSMHSGTEYSQDLKPIQTEFAHAAIDAGADLVLGSHPHVPQREETYNGKHILYSLGNFVFDQMWSDETRHGMTAKVTLTKSGVQSFELIPIFIENDYQPTLLK